MSVLALGLSNARSQKVILSQLLTKGSIYTIALPNIIIVGGIVEYQILYSVYFIEIHAINHLICNIVQVEVKILVLV